MSDKSKYTRFLKLIVVIALFTSYAFWYQKYCRSYGILLISLIGIVALIRGEYSYSKSEFTWRDNMLLSSLLLFSVYHLMRSLFGWDAWNEFDRYSRAMLAIPFGLVLIQISGIGLYRVLKFLIACSIVSFFIAFMYYYYFLGKVRVINLGMNEIQLSFTCSIYAVMALCLVFYSQNSRDKIAWTIIFFVSLYEIIMTARLSGFLFLALTTFLSACYIVKNYSTISWLTFAAFLLAIIFSFFYFTNTYLEVRLLYMTEFLFGFIKNWDMVFTEGYPVEKDASISPRLLLWKHGFQLINHDFWFGIGKNSLHDSYVDKAALIKFFGNTAPNLHNGFIHELVVKGYVGFLLFLSIIVTPLCYFWDAYKSEFSVECNIVSLMGVGVVLVFIINNLTQVIFGHMNGVMMYSFTVMLLWAALYSLRNGVDTPAVT